MTLVDLLRSSKSNNNVKEALNCFTHMSCALKERFTDKIAKLCNDVCDSMIDEV